MLNALKKMFGIKQAEAPVVEVPYKIEQPVVAANDTVAEPIVAKKAPAKKAPAVKKPRTPKPPKK